MKIVANAILALAQAIAGREDAGRNAGTANISAAAGATPMISAAKKVTDEIISAVQAVTKVLSGGILDVMQSEAQKIASGKMQDVHTDPYEATEQYMREMGRGGKVVSEAEAESFFQVQEARGKMMDQASKQAARQFSYMPDWYTDLVEGGQELSMWIANDVLGHTKRNSSVHQNNRLHED